MSLLNQWLAQLPGWGVYLLILVLTAVVYQTTFARALPLLKNVIVYLVLALGCGLFYLFHLMGFPMIPALLITVVLIVLTKIRLAISARQQKKKAEQQQEA